MGDPTVGSKVMAILTRFASLADQTSLLMSSDSLATQRKLPPETRAKIWKQSNGRIESYSHFDSLVKSGRPYLFIIELRFRSNPKENSFKKLMQTFQSDPMVWSKVIAILTRYASLADQISTSTSSDYIETPRKMASEN
jgi:hypothetical protein